ncbi:uncharacterized protein LOC142353368 [Convolutriloba macropyga]|uniref:uncharacterized protein LOC142353368 n=1 Tax=Convolutriloba macropyga TaxID=536237 RepID=UPI003F5251BE
MYGSADKYHIWTKPAHGLCANWPRGVCELDITETTLHITGLIPGQGYRVFFKALSYDKESEITTIEQALYTDDLESFYTTNDINSPGRITLLIISKSGTGKKHIVEMITTADVPRRLWRSWKKRRVINFDIKPGGLYQFNVTARSKGNFPLERRHDTYRIAFPDTPLQYSYTPYSDTKRIAVSFYVYGVIHGWIITSSEGSCASECDLQAYRSDHTVSGLGAGKTITIKVFAYVHYPNEQRKLGLPLVIYYGTLPGRPSVEASSSCYSVTLTVRKKTNCKEFDFYYKTDDSLRKSVSCSNSETIVQFLSLRSSRWHSFWVAARTNFGLRDYRALSVYTSYHSTAQICHKTGNSKQDKFSYAVDL